MKISIAMATYNGERFIQEQLESLAAQTRLPDELVVSDDLSKDRTIEVIEEFARTAPFPVRIYRNERNLGFGDNFLRAAKSCCGDWIAFCDQDDVWLPEKLAVCEQYANLPRHEVMVVSHNAEVVDESLRRSGVRYLRTKKTVVCNGRRLPHLWVASGFTMMFRARLISEVPCDDRGPDPGLPSSKLAHDVWISRIARIVGDVVIIPECLALYRRHGMTTTNFLAGGNQAVRDSKRLSRRIHALSIGGDENYRRHSLAAACQSKVFGALAFEVEPEIWRERFLSAEMEYDRLSKWLLLRSRMYGERRFLRRILYFSRLAFRGGYLRFNGYSLLNAGKMLKDVVLDVAMSFYGPREGGAEEDSLQAEPQGKDGCRTYAKVSREGGRR